MRQSLYFLRHCPDAENARCTGRATVMLRSSVSGAEGVPTDGLLGEVVLTPRGHTATSNAVKVRQSASFGNIERENTRQITGTARLSLPPDLGATCAHRL